MTSLTANRVVAELGREILDGSRVPGDTLPTERELCTRFGSSRTVVREAIQQLRARGLITGRQGSGNFVACPSTVPLGEAITHLALLNREYRTFIELLDLRMVLECRMAELAAVSREDTHLARMQASLDTLAASRDIDALSQADVDFHLAIAEAADNQLMHSILAGLRQIGRQFGKLTYEPSVVKTIYRQHLAIYRDIQSGAPAKAANDMLEHISFAKAHFLRLRELLDMRSRNAS